MLILPHCAIYHIPKTAGTYIRSLLDHNKVSYQLIYIKTNRIYPRTFANELVDDRGDEQHHLPLPGHPHPALMLTRHPIDWYISYYAQRKSYPYNTAWGWNPYREFDRKVADENFKEFIVKVMRNYPAPFLWQLYTTFKRYSAKVGKMETLLTDVGAFIKEHEGVELKPLEKRINTHPHPEGLDGSILKPLLEYEAVTMKEYGYDG